MINYIYGKIAHVSKSYVVLESYGIGYRINFKNPPFEAGVGKKLYIHTVSKLDQKNCLSQELYGFETAVEKMLFADLLQINGIGPIIASNVLSLGYKKVISCIISEDVEQLKLIKGLNDKSARQIIASLFTQYQKIAEAIGITQKDNQNGDLISALKELGYNDNDISLALDIDQSLDLEERIGKSIRIIATHHENLKS